MNETSKTLRYYPHIARTLAVRHFNGKALDIGAGADPLVLEGVMVDVWDKEQGDAQYLATIPDESYDIVWSSHCLEHMVDVPTAIQNWCRVLKPNGTIVIIVPDFLLYEKGRWPSLMNYDHKATFDGGYHLRVAGRNNHYTPERIHDLLKDNRVYIEDEEVMSDGMSFSGRDFLLDQTHGDALSQIYYEATKYRSSKVALQANPPTTAA